MEPEFATLTSASELSSQSDRWTTQRKAAVVIAVRSGQIALDEVCRRYTLSVDEFVARERDFDRYDAPGLRATRYQIYRQTEVRDAG